MMEFTRALDGVSAVRYAIHKLIGGTRPLPLRLRSGIRFLMRPGNAENTDYGVAYEVFVNQDYRPPADLDPASVGLIVDVSGNVGFSALYWLNTFPNCTVEVYEPYPLHVVQMGRNLERAGVRDRAVVHAQAAGTSAGTAVLLRAGTSSSTLGGDGGGDGFSVEMVDLLSVLDGRRVDILKLDLEGGEYAILADDRFAALDVGDLVMEWHVRDDAEADRRWCEERLASMGYRVQPLAERPTANMLWARRQIR